MNIYGLDFLLDDKKKKKSYTKCLYFQKEGAGILLNWAIKKKVDQMPSAKDS